MNESVSNELTVILPCAGSGTRLGLDSPKELYEIWPQFPFIRFALEHIKLADSTATYAIRVVLVIKEGKESLIEWVREFLGDNVDVVAIYSESLAGEWPASIFSARSYFSKQNIVLLPDTCSFVSERNWLQDQQGKGLLQSLVESLEKSSFSLASVTCGDSVRLRKLGALKIANTEVLAFQDKPDQPSKAEFNAFWSAMAFDRKVADELFDLLQRSVRHEPYEFDAFSFFPATSLNIASHVDFGTWEVIREYQKSYGSFEEFHANFS